MATFFIESIDDPLMTDICQLFSGGQNSYTPGEHHDRKDKLRF